MPVDTGASAVAVQRDARADGADAPEGAPRTAPRHVAVIMDGNGRWAARRGLPRIEGHRQGVEAVRRCVRLAIEAGVEFLTIYSFSAENWSRPRQEVLDLMGLLKRFVRSDLARLHESGVRVRVIGEREGLGEDILSVLREAEERTRDNTRLTLVVAFNYGGRQEIARAARALAELVRDGRLAPEDITVERFAEALDTRGMPDPDLVIRTSGEQRVSNFLTWQSAYAEYVFTPEFWPDFDRAVFEAALAEYARRERRFGGLGSGACA